MILSLLLLTAQTLQAPPADALDAARNAMGILAPDAALVFESSLELFGVPARAKTTIDGRGRFVQEIQGHLRTSTGFDGETCWAVDWSGIPTRQVLGDLEQAVLAMWFQTGLWLSPEIALDRTIDPSTTPPTVLVSLPTGGIEARVTLEEGTFAPKSMEMEGVTISLFDLHEASGVKVPTRVSTSRNNRSADERIDSVTQDKIEEASFFAPRLAYPIGDFDFDPEKSPELEVKRARSGHLLARVRLEDEKSAWFIFDSGAGILCIDEKVADDFAMKDLGMITALGVGGPVLSKLRQGESLEVGPLTLDGTVYLEQDLAFLSSALGEEISGIIGHGLFSRAIVEIEFAGPRIALHDPDAELTLEAPWEELVLYNRHPCVHCRFEGDREGLFKLDTGAAGTLSFHAPAVKSLGLLEGREVVQTSAGGVGGQKTLQSGHIDFFELGGHRFENPRVEFYEGNDGAFADSSTIGNIGEKFLQPFRLVFDYRRARIAFVKRGTN